MTDVWLSLESLGPFTLSSCQTEERNHYLAGPLSQPIPHHEPGRKKGRYEKTKTYGHPPPLYLTAYKLLVPHPRSPGASEPHGVERLDAGKEGL